MYKFFHPYIDPCDIIACHGSTKCVVQSDNTPNCKCPTCNEKYKPVCGSDGRTYANKCYLTSMGCNKGNEASVAKETACGINLIIFKVCE